MLLLVISACNRTVPPAESKPTLTRDEAVSLAKTEARSAGRDLSKYSDPKAELSSADGKWRVTFSGTVIPSPGNYFVVEIDPKTGKAIVIPGE